MGRGAHATHAAYNGGGTQALAVTDKINKNEDLRSVFINENVSTKQIVHGCNISEMTCAGKSESITSERYKIFTPDENSDMLGDVYLNFEMDSKITDIKFEDLLSDTTYDLQTQTGDLSQSFSLAGEDFNSMNIDLSTRLLPDVVTPASSHSVGNVNKILNITDSGINYEIVAGRGTHNIAIRNLTGDDIWYSYVLSHFSEIIDIALISVANIQFLIIGGVPVGSDPYKVLKLSDLVNAATIGTPQSNLIDIINGTTSLKIVTTIIEHNTDSIFISGFKDHTDEVLRAPEHFHTDFAETQTTFEIKTLSYNANVMTAVVSNAVSFDMPRDTISKRLSSYNYKDCILSSAIKYDDINTAYITGAKQKVLLGLDNNNKIKRSYDNGSNWEDVNMYYGPDNYYPLSKMYQKNETLTHEQLNQTAFVINDYTQTMKLSALKSLYSNLFGYVINDIKLINRNNMLEYSDNVTVQNILNLSVYAVPNDPSGTRATGTAAVDNGAISSITVNDAGSGFDGTETVIITGIGSGAAASITVSSNNVSVQSVSFTIPAGVFWEVTPSITIDLPVGDPSGTPAVAVATMAAAGLGSFLTLSSIQVTVPGSGYNGTETVTISDGITMFGMGSPYTPVTSLNFTSGSGGAVTGFTVTAAGSGYVIGKKTDLRPYLDIRIKNMPVINDYDHIWVNIPKNNNSAPMKPIWPIGKNIRMTSKKFTGPIVGFDILAPGTYSSTPNVSVAPSDPNGTHAVLTAVLTSQGISSIVVIDGGSGYDGTETVVIDGGGGGSARVIIDQSYARTQYLTLGEFKQNINAMTGLTNNQYSLSIIYTLNGIDLYSGSKVPQSFVASSTEFDNTNVADLGFLQTKKIDIEVSQDTSIFQIPADAKSVRLGGTAKQCSNKPVDERLNDKLNFYMVIAKNETVQNLKLRLKDVYGGVEGNYLVCIKNVTAATAESVAHLHADTKKVYGDPSTDSIITHVTGISDEIIDTFSSPYNLEIRFADNHPLRSDTYLDGSLKIIYISIPLTPGTSTGSGGEVPRRTVSVLAEDLTSRYCITISQLKTKIKKLLGTDFYEGVINNADYKFNLVSGGNHNGTSHSSDNKNLYRSGIDETKRIDQDEHMPLTGGDIVYLFISRTNTSVAQPYTLMSNNNLINVSFGTDPMYSEIMISRIGVLDDLKYYIPEVKFLVNNDKGLWVAAGPPGDASGTDFSVTGGETSIPRLNLAIFVSNNDGYNWYPLKFSVISEGTSVHLRPKYDAASVSDYNDPEHRIEFISGYVSNLQGDIRITFNITKSDAANPQTPVVLETSGILDIDHYQICPNVISNNTTIKALNAADILQRYAAVNLTLATSINNEFDIYVHKADGKNIISQTINSDIKYLYNNPTFTLIANEQTEDILAYKKLAATIISIRKTSAVQPVYELVKESFVGNKIPGSIPVDGQTTWTSSTSVPEFETDSLNRAVLLTESPPGKYNIYSYDNSTGNFIKVVTADYAYSSISFLENIWIVTTETSKYLTSYDTIHWREVSPSSSGGAIVDKIYAKNVRHHKSILVTGINESVLGFKPKELANNIDRYLGLSLFHDRTVKGGIKVNIDEELIADRTNYIIESYITPLKIVPQEVFKGNFGTLYEPNDVIKNGNRIIICGNGAGRADGTEKTLTLIESTEISDYSFSHAGFSNTFLENKDDIVFFGAKSLYTNHRLQNNKKDFICNFDMERFYRDTNVSSDIIYCSGSYTKDGNTYGILAIRSLPSLSERSQSHGNTYFWKLIYAPGTSSDDVPITNYDPPIDFNEIRAPWQDTVFEKINDIVFADDKVVIVGKGIGNANLCLSDVSYPGWFGYYGSSSTSRKVELEFEEIYTVCFYKRHWFVGGRPKYKKDTGNNLIKNNVCLAYTDDIANNKWIYTSFPLQDGGEQLDQLSSSSIHEVNNMEIVNINGNTSILTNISYVARAGPVVGFTFPEKLIMAVIFIDLDNRNNLTFSNHTPFKSPGIEEFSATSERTFNGFLLAEAAPGFSVNREKWLNRPFDLEIDGISRKIISTIHSPKTKDMYYVGYNSIQGFILNSYRDPFIPIIDKTANGEYPKFIKHIKLGAETLANKTRGHCYKIAEVKGDNFINGVGSARYVAVGKGVLSPISHSDDFEKWTYSDASKVFDVVFDVVHKHGVWIAIGEGKYNVGLSKDGKSWTGIYPKNRANLMTTSTHDTTFNSFAFSEGAQRLTDILPYIPEIKGIFLRNLSILRLFSRIEYHVGNQIWQTLTFDDIKAMLDTEFGAGEYANLLKNCSTINKNGVTAFTTWIPGFTKTLNSKLETFHNISESGSFPSGLLKGQKLSIKVYYNNLENIIGTNDLVSSNMNNRVFDNFMNNTLIPCDRDPNYFIDSFLADNYGFQLGDTYSNVNGEFNLKFSTEIQRLRVYCKKFELDDTEIDIFNKGVVQNPKITQSLYFDADNAGNLLLDLDDFNMYASHIIISGWLTSTVCIKDMNLELNGYSYNKTMTPDVIDFSTKLYLGLNYNRYTFNGVDKEDGIGSLVIPLASSAYSGSSVPLDRYNSIRLRINFNTVAGPRSYINVTCVGTTTVSYKNSTANIDLF